MPTPDGIQKLISETIDCSICTVTGDGQHFFATIVSKAFTGNRRLQRHRLVYQTLGERMDGEIHALSMETFTPDEWQEIQNKRRFR